MNKYVISCSCLPSGSKKERVAKVGKDTIGAGRGGGHGGEPLKLQEL